MSRFRPWRRHMPDMSTPVFPANRRRSIRAAGAERKTLFTLLELVAALAILSVVLGIALPMVGRIPAFLTLESAAHPLQTMLQEAGIRALHQGRLVTIRVARDLERETVSFTLEGEGGGGAGLYSPAPTPPVTIAPPVTVLFPGIPDDQPVRFQFHPDGGADGPEVLLILRGRALRLGVSPLTGLPFRQEEDASL